MPTPTRRRSFDRSLRWVDPGAGLGDALVLSGVLRAGFERFGERFGVIRAQPSSSLFMGHPAVAGISRPPEGAVTLVRTDVFAADFPAGDASMRPAARLSLALFGEILQDAEPWAPVTDSDRRGLRHLPLSVSPIVIAPDAGAWRAEWPSDRWRSVVGGLAWAGVPIVQVGVSRRPVVPGAINLSGKLAPRESLALLGLAQACVAVDPFVIHGARMTSTPAVVIRGPASAAFHGYDSQVNIEAGSRCEPPCLDLARDGFTEPCPTGERCIETISAAAVLEAFASRVPRPDPKRSLLD